MTREGTPEVSSRQPRAGITPPIWQKLDEAGWLEFRGKFGHYSQTIEDQLRKEWYQCLSDKLTRQLRRLAKDRLIEGDKIPEDAPEGATLMKNLSWEEAQKTVNNLLAPSTHASALGMFSRIKMEETTDPIKFTLTSLNYIDDFEQAYKLAKDQEGIELDEEQLVKTFTKGITSAGVKERLRAMNPDTCKAAFDKLMDLAELVRIAAENANLFTGEKSKRKPRADSKKGGAEEGDAEKKTVKGECYRCGRTNHKKADCRAIYHGKTGDLLLIGERCDQNGNGKKKKLKTSVKNQGTFKNENATTELRGATYAEAVTGKAPPMQVEVDRSRSESHPNTVEVAFQGDQEKTITAQAIADTGASDNFIRQEYLRKQGTSQKLKVLRESKRRQKFRTANGHLTTKGTITLRIDKIKVQHGKVIKLEEETTFQVTDNLPYDCVIGRPFLEAMELIKGPLFQTKKGQGKRDGKRQDSTRESSETRKDAQEAERESKAEEAASTQEKKPKDSRGEIEDYDPQTLKHITNESDRRKFVELMNSFSDLYGIINKPASYPPVEIQLMEGKKIPQQAMPRVADTQLPAVRKKLQEMLELGVLERSTSPASSRYLMVPKPNNDIRLTVDLRDLNSKCMSVKESMPTTREILVQTKGASIFCTLDLSKYYYQLELAKQSRYLTAMSTPIGKLQFTRLPMGYKNSPAIGAAALQTLLQLHPKGPGRGSCSYVDDILIYATNMDDLYDDLQEVLTKLRRAGLKLSKDKARVAVKTVEYVGHEISAFGTAPKASRTQGVRGITMPTTKKEARSFCGVMNYSRDYIKDLSRLLKPIYEVIGSTAKFEWGESQKQAFAKAKTAFIEATPLEWWREGRTTILQTDASEIGIGAVLFQLDNQGKRHTLGFYSEAFNRTQSRWSTIEQEGYGIFKAVTHWHHILYGRPFVVRTDHANLRFMEKSINKKVGRWWTTLTNYNMEIEHTPGETNVVADGMSRLPDSSTTEPEEEEVSTCKPVILCAQEGGDQNNETKETSKEKGSEENAKEDTFEEAFQRNHNAITGHMGVEETTRRLQRERPNEIKLTEKVRKRIQKCAWCQKDRLKAPTVEPKRNVLSVTEPFTSISIDTMGPLPEDEEGNQFIIVVVDDFTRYCELFPAPDTTAQSAAKALVATTGRYGRISHVRSDGGSQYINDTISKLKETLGLTHSKSWPYHPQANGRVERAIKEVGRHLRTLVVTLKIANRWSSVLPMVARICNTTPSRKTGLTPAEILYGKAIDLDRDMVQTPRNANDSGPRNHYPQIARDLIKTQERLTAKAIEVQNKEDERYLAKSPENPTEFPIDTLVLARHVKDIRPHKLASIWEGPLRILKRDGKNYECRHLATGKETRYDVTRLREYIEDEQVDAVEVASYDNQEDIVKEVTAHRLKKGKKESNKGSWEFQIVWLDNSKEWLNYMDVKNMEAFEKYVNDAEINMFKAKKPQGG